MKKFLRLTAATFTLVVAVAGFALFEYWKLLESDYRFAYGGILAVLALFGSLYLFFPAKEYAWKRWCKGASVFVIFLIACEILFLKVKGRSDLNQVLNAKGRCESVFVEIFGSDSDGMFRAAQNACSLRMLQDRLQVWSLSDGEEKLGLVGRLLDNANRLDETALVVLLSDYSALENKRIESVHHDLPEEALKDELSVVEGSLVLLEIYHPKALFENGTATMMEAARVKKMVELSTLGKTFGIFLARARGAIEAYSLLGRSRAKNPQFDSGEYTLLGMRVQKLKDSLSRIQTSWNLPAKLDGLNVKDTFPEQYQKVRADITFEPL